MKKILIPFIVILIFGCFLINKEKSAFYKVFFINSPTDFFIDYNKNFIFDETEPFTIKDILYISKNKDYSKDEILNLLSDEQKFLFEYFAKEYSNNLIKNKFIKIKNNEIYINNKPYKNLLINSGFFYNNTIESKKNILKNIQTYNTDEYYILNTRTKKYHKLNCPNGHNSKQYKIIKKENLLTKYTKAKCCLKEEPENTNTQIIDKQTEKTSQTPIIKVNDNFLNNNIKIYFLDLNSTFKPDNNCTTKACIELKEQINNAVSTIDFAIYGFNNQPEIYNALKKAKERGIKLRWITNYEPADNKYYPDIDKLKCLLPDYKTNKNFSSDTRYSIMHNKFFIFDNKKVFTGSANITSTDLSGFNANYSVLIDSNKVAQIYTNEFNQMYNGNFNINKKIHDTEKIILPDNTEITVLFSPQNLIIDNRILKLIKNAKEYIYIPAFFITQKNILNELISAKNRQVEIKIINDATNASSKYTIHKKLRAAGIKVKTENYAGKMHMKSIIIDDKYTIIGSMNFTSSGNHKNDENVLIIKDKKTAQYMKDTFLHIWNKIPAKYEYYDPKAESLESIGSCFDGIDNDFDGKIDEKDEGCFTKK